MDVLQLLDRLEEAIGSGWHIPGTGRTAIDEGDLLDLIDAIRGALPEEIRTAQQVTRERDTIIEQASVQAEQVVAEAQQRADELVSEQTLYQNAQRQAKTLLERAAEQAQDIRNNADDYAMDSLTRLEAQLSQTLATVRNGIETLREETDDER